MLLVRHKADNVNGYQKIINYQEHCLKWLEFGLINLKAPIVTVSQSTFDHEAALVILDGTVDVTVEGQTWHDLGGRASVFEEPATTVYVPKDSEYAVSTKGDTATLAVCRARAEKRFQPFVVLPDQIQTQHRGKGHWRRDVRDILVAGYDDRIDRLVVGETINYPGEWSGYPPHKHDEETPEETIFEEIYHYRVNPADGFGVQLHYQSKQNEDAAYLVRNGDTFAIPDGYHPLSAAGGYQVYYLWCMAGPVGRILKPFEDPRHRWVHEVE